MAKLKFRTQGGEIVTPADREQIAGALAEVRAGLEHIKDPRVWDGHPDGWPENADEDEPGAPVGLVLNLERCTRGNPTWQMARAIEIAFALGKLSENKGTDVEALRERLVADWRRVNSIKGGIALGKKLQAKAAAWHAEVRPIWWERRGQFPHGVPSRRRWSNRRLAAMIVDDYAGKIPGLPKYDQVLETIKAWNTEQRTQSA